MMAMPVSLNIVADEIPFAEDFLAHKEETFLSMLCGVWDGSSDSTTHFASLPQEGDWDWTLQEI